MTDKQPRRRPLRVHPLATWLKRKKLSQSAFARLAGIDRSTLCKVLAGLRAKFSAEESAAIIKATEGEVTLEACVWGRRAP